MVSRFTLLILLALTQTAFGQTLVPMKETSFTFTKGPTGFIIDSLVFKTSLQNEFTGIPFPDDTLQMRLLVVDGADQLYVEAYGGGVFIDGAICWVEPPSANVELFIDAGLLRISPDVSEKNKAFLLAAAALQKASDERERITMLISAALEAKGTIMGAKFMEEAIRSPQLSSFDLANIDDYLREYFTEVNRHPFFDPIYARINVLFDELPVRLRRYRFSDWRGRTVQYKLPKKTGYVINFFHSENPDSPIQHEQIQVLLDSTEIFEDIQMVSISTEQSEAIWKDYVRLGKYPWPHLKEIAGERRRVSERFGWFSGNMFFLLNGRQQVIGIYDSVELLRQGILYRRSL